MDWSWWYWDWHSECLWADLALATPHYVTLSIYWLLLTRNYKTWLLMMYCYLNFSIEIIITCPVSPDPHSMETECPHLCYYLAFLAYYHVIEYFVCWWFKRPQYLYIITILVIIIYFLYYWYKPEVRSAFTQSKCHNVQIIAGNLTRTSVSQCPKIKMRVS